MNYGMVLRQCMVAMLLLIVFSNTNYSIAQSFSQYDTITIGLKGGIEYINLVGKKNEDFKTVSGYQFGVFIERNIFQDWIKINNVSLRSELIYSRRSIQINDKDINILIFDGAEIFLDEEIHGFSLDRNTGGLLFVDEIFNEEIYTTINYQFINAPLRFNYLVFPKSNIIRPFLSIAPVFSILLNIDQQFTLITESGAKYTQSDIDKRVNTHFRRFNLGLEYGGGIQLPLGFFIEAYYSMGLTESLVHYESSTKKRGVVANIGYRF